MHIVLAKDRKSEECMLLSVGVSQHDSPDL